VDLDSDHVATAPGQLVGLEVDLEHATITVRDVGDVWATERTFDFDDPRAFAAISEAWLRVAWDVKHQWSYSWLGRPVIQLPEDLVRLQEVIWRLRPDVIVETGVAHGGTLVFCATLCKAIGHGRVVGVELPRSPELDHREAIMAHPLADYITLIHGDSVDPLVVDRVHDDVGEASALLLLDSCHERRHVFAELEAYGDLVPPGSYAIAQDGAAMQLVARTHGPRAGIDWLTNNPLAAVRDFAATHPGWLVDEPDPPFDEGAAPHSVTHWTGGWLRRLD